MTRSDVLRIALASALAESAPSPARANDDVRVRVPEGVGFSGSTTTPAGDGQDYVTVTGLEFRNASAEAQSYRAKDLHLIVHDRPYLPVVRPHLGAIDTIEDGIVGPHETLRLSATFLVPAGTSRGDLEFTPRWIDEAGRTLDFCCYYE